MKRFVRIVTRRLFRGLLRVKVPLPAGARDLIRDATRNFFHRSRFFRHESRVRIRPLALRLIHECLVRTIPSEFDVYGGRLRFQSAGSPMSVHGYYVGEFEYHLIRFIVDRLTDRTLVLDIGAHHGEFAVPIAYEFKRRQWCSRIWSFEPDPGNAACLRNNLTVNGLSDYVDLFIVAVSDQASETAELLCPADNSSNTLASNAKYAIGEELPTVRRRVVKTIRLDDLDLESWRIGIIKLDIQGSEPEALRGAAATLSRHRPILVIEVVESWPRAAEVRHILGELGYTVHGLTKSGEMVDVHDPRVFVSWDWIAVPRAVEYTGRPSSASAADATRRSA